MSVTALDFEKPIVALEQEYAKLRESLQKKAMLCIFPPRGDYSVNDDR